MTKTLKIFILIISVCLISRSYANEYDFGNAVHKYNQLKLKKPIAELDGRIQTLNKKGGISPKSDKTTIEFIEFSQGKKVLEIGGGVR